MVLIRILLPGHLLQKFDVVKRKDCCVETILLYKHSPKETALEKFHGAWTIARRILGSYNGPNKTWQIAIVPMCFCYWNEEVVYKKTGKESPELMSNKPGWFDTKDSGWNVQMSQLWCHFARGMPIQGARMWNEERESSFYQDQGCLERKLAFQAKMEIYAEDEKVNGKRLNKILEKE
ncbi:hypothetical protein Tco_1371380 [Tanacetum coccineum]